MIELTLLTEMLMDVRERLSGLGMISHPPLPPKRCRCRLMRDAAGSQERWTCGQKVVFEGIDREEAFCRVITAFLAYWLFISIARYHYHQCSYRTYTSDVSLPEWTFLHSSISHQDIMLLPLERPSRSAEAGAEIATLNCQAVRSASQTDRSK